MTTHFFLFRHGETDWNLEGRFQGHTDIPLNSRGRLQAESLREKLNFIKPNMIISSDLSRARETAEIGMTDLSQELSTFYELRETLIGEPEGMLRVDIEKKYGLDFLKRWGSSDPKDAGVAFPGGETNSQTLVRVRGFLEKFALDNKQAKRIAVVTHGGVLRKMVHSCQAAPKELVPIPNCCGFEIYFEHSSRSWHFKQAL